MQWTKNSIYEYNQICTILHINKGVYMAHENIKRLTIQISTELHEQLEMLADRAGQPKTAICSLAVMYGLQQIEDGIKNPVARAAEKSIDTMLQLGDFMNAFAGSMGMKKNKKGEWQQLDLIEEIRKSEGTK